VEFTDPNSTLALLAQGRTPTSPTPTPKLVAVSTLKKVLSQPSQGPESRPARLKIPEAGSTMPVD
jgi:hypothetical protein